MKNEYSMYLIGKEYKEITSSGNPSTVYDYTRRVECVCKLECITWEELACRIKTIVEKYGVGGEKEVYGRTSNNAVINALRRFLEFVSAKEEI